MTFTTNSAYESNPVSIETLLERVHELNALAPAGIMPEPLGERLYGHSLADVAAILQRLTGEPVPVVENDSILTLLGVPLFVDPSIPPGKFEIRPTMPRITFGGAR